MPSSYTFLASHILPNTYIIIFQLAYSICNIDLIKVVYFGLSQLVYYDHMSFLVHLFLSTGTLLYVSAQFSSAYVYIPKQFTRSINLLSIYSNPSIDLSLLSFFWRHPSSLLLFFTLSLPPDLSAFQVYFLALILYFINRHLVFSFSHVGASVS